MKTKYCYIPQVEDYGERLTVYAVYVGQSSRELAQCRVLDALACQNGGFFRPWDRDTDDYLISLGYGFFSVSEQVHRHVERIDFNIQDIMRKINDGSLSMAKNPSFVTRNIIHQLSAFSPSFYLQSHARRAKVMCNSVARKYLSHDEMGDLVKATGFFCLILVLFLIVGYLDGVEPVIMQY